MHSTIERLRKLIAHEQSARSIGSVAEAETFATRIQEILTRHKLSMSEVDCEREDASNPIGETSSTIKTASLDIWIEILAEAVAISLYCRSIWYSGSGSTKARACFVGREADRGTAASLFNYLYALGLDLAASAAVRATNSPNIQSQRILFRNAGREQEFSKVLNRIMRRWKRDYLRGYAVALYKRLTRNKRDMETEAGAGATALVLRDQEAITEYCHQVLNVTERPGRARKPAFGNAFASGYKAGNEINIDVRGTLAP